LHVASVVVGAIVGVGIFFTPASLARALPSPGWILAVWLLGGIASVAGALVYADLGARYPHAGGVYVFLREGFGPRAGPFVAFQYGWLQLLVIQPGSMAVIAIVLVDNLGYLIGPLPGAARSAAAAGAIALFTVSNLLGLRIGGGVQIVMAALKLTALSLLIGIGLGWGGPDNLAGARATAPEGGPASWVILGLIPVLFSFGGAYHGTFIAGAVRDPERAVPRGIVAGIGVVLVAYLAVNVAYLGLLGHDGLARSESPAADAAALALGPSAGKVLAAVIVVSAAGILNTVCLGFPFVIYAMAQDGLFFARAARLDARTGRPALAVAAQGGLACAAVYIGQARVDLLLTGIAFADAIFQAAVALVLFGEQRRRPTGATPGAPTLRSPPVATATLFVLSLGLAIGCLIQKPQESSIGAAVLVIGVVLYAAWRRA
jgi:APA family basic amino acid/polyamine antiporter